MALLVDIGTKILQLFWPTGGATNVLYQLKATISVIFHSNFFNKNLIAVTNFLTKNYRTLLTCLFTQFIWC